MHRSASIVLLMMGVAAFAGGVSALDTNICGVNWYYCPRDPGCKTYTMSVHNIIAHANNHTDPIKMEDLRPGDSVTIVITGKTTMKEVPVAGSYRIYGLDGKNVATGILTGGVLVLHPGTPNGFTMTVTFTLDSDNFDETKTWTEWTLDVFQQKSGSDEGMCVEFADVEYLHYEQNKPDPPFVDYCVDNGDGTFTAKTVAVPSKEIAAPACAAAPCALKWNWCPRDPGCKTYTMVVDNVEVDVTDQTQQIRSGDLAHVVVTGTTTLKTVPTAGSYRIYSLAGVNVAAGALSNALTVSNGKFVLTVDFDLSSNCFDETKGFFEFGIDVFQKGSGSDEGMCIEVSNPAYVAYEENNPDPPFVTDCEMTHFPFLPVAGGVKEVEHDVVCKFV